MTIMHHLLLHQPPLCIMLPSFLSTPVGATTGWRNCWIIPNCYFNQMKSKPLELAHVGGIFILLAIGLAAAALSVLCEFGKKYFHWNIQGGPKKGDLRWHGHNSSEIHQKWKKLFCFRKFSVYASYRIGTKPFKWVRKMKLKLATPL